MLVSFPAMKGNNKALKTEKGEKAARPACSIYGLRGFSFSERRLISSQFSGESRCVVSDTSRLSKYIIPACSGSLHVCLPRFILHARYRALIPHSPRDQNKTQAQQVFFLFK